MIRMKPTRAPKMYAEDYHTNGALKREQVVTPTQAGFHT